jgi:hypothetical protein
MPFINRYCIVEVGQANSIGNEQEFWDCHSFLCVGKIAFLKVV